jgi:hypothetical protein
MVEPQNRNNNNDGNGRPNEWFNSKFIVFCMLIGVAVVCAMVCGTVYLVTANSSKTVEEDGRYREMMMRMEIRQLQLQQQAKHNENVSG